MLRGHEHQTTILNKNSRTQTKMRLSLLSESSRHSICYILSLILFNKLCSHFLWALYLISICKKPKAFLAGPVESPLGPRAQPASINTTQRNAWNTPRFNQLHHSVLKWWTFVVVLILINLFCTVATKINSPFSWDSFSIQFLDQIAFLH